MMFLGQIDHLGRLLIVDWKNRMCAWLGDKYSEMEGAKITLRLVFE
jgi:hypothetical protein